MLGRNNRQSPNIDYEKIIPIVFIASLLALSLLVTLLPKDLLYKLSTLPLYLKVF